MVGMGPIKEEIFQIIKDKRLEDDIIIKDFISNSELPKTYQQSVLFALSSYEEGVPRTILEAMSCETPIVCTNLPQIKDLVEGCGIIVPIGDPSELAKGFSRIVRDYKFAQECGEQGRKKILANYSWEDTVDRTLSIYEDLVHVNKSIMIPSELDEKMAIQYNLKREEHHD